MRLTESRVDFEAADHATWRAFHSEFFARIDRFEALLHPYYRQHLGVLARLKERIPTLSMIERILAPHGWTATYVDGYTAPWLIARLIARRVLPLSRRIRPPHEVFFASEPDLIHDVFGHLPCLLSPEYRKLLARWAQVASREPVTELDRAHYHLNKLIVQAQDRVPNGALSHLLTATQALGDYVAAQPSRAQIQDRIYFWIFEFGIVESASQRQILGAGILSSLTELTKIATQQVNTRLLTPASFLASYNISSEQSEYLTVRRERDFLDFLDAVAPRQRQPRTESNAPLERSYAHG